jgi:hypothetical protein
MSFRQGCSKKEVTYTQKGGGLLPKKNNGFQNKLCFKKNQNIPWKHGKKKNDKDEIGNMLKHVFTSLLLGQKSRGGSSHLSWTISCSV